MATSEHYKRDNFRYFVGDVRTLRRGRQQLSVGSILRDVIQDYLMQKIEHRNLRFRSGSPRRSLSLFPSGVRGDIQSVLPALHMYDFGRFCELEGMEQQTKKFDDQREHMEATIDAFLRKYRGVKRVIPVSERLEIS